MADSNNNDKMAPSDNATPPPSPPPDAPPPVDRPSLKTWPWPTRSQLDTCWYICTTCFEADLTLERHIQHCMTYHTEHVIERQGFMTQNLHNFLEAASLVHEHWIEGTDSASKCYQQRISKGEEDLPTDRIALLDNAACVYYFERDGSVRGVFVNENLMERLQWEASEILVRAVQGVADRIEVIEMLTEEGQEGGKGDSSSCSSDCQAPLTPPTSMWKDSSDDDEEGMSETENVPEVNDEEMPESESLAAAVSPEVAQPEPAGPSGVVAAEEAVEGAAQIITFEMFSLALAQVMQKAESGQKSWPKKRKIKSRLTTKKTMKKNKVAGLQKRLKK